MKVLILNSKSGQQDLVTYGKDLLDELTNNYDTVIYEEVNNSFSNVKELFDDSEKLILFNQFSLKEGFTQLTKSLPSFKNVKYILSPYSSYAGLDLELLKAKGIHYRNNAGANAKSIAQYAITAMFMLLSKFPIFTQTNEMPDGSILGEEYHGKTAGIIGMGNVGIEIFNILKALGIETTYFNRSERNIDAKRVTYEEVLKQDIVFVTIASNPDTLKMFENFSKLLQPNNYIIDITTPDNLYSKDKVLELLDNNKLKGYSIEVSDPTVISLESKNNFIATPHIAWCTVDAERRTVINYLNRSLTILKGEDSKVDFIV